MRHSILLLVWLLACGLMATESVQVQEGDVVHFLQSLHSAVGDPSNSIEELAYEAQPEYAALNTDGTLGVALTALHALRVLDLQTSLAHAERLRLLLARLTSP